MNKNTKKEKKKDWCVYKDINLFHILNQKRLEQKERCNLG